MHTALLYLVGLGDFNILTHHSRWLLLRFKYPTKTKTKVDDYLCEITEHVCHPETTVISTLELLLPLKYI